MAPDRLGNSMAWWKKYRTKFRKMGTPVLVQPLPTGGISLEKHSKSESVWDLRWLREALRKAGVKTAVRNVRCLLPRLCANTLTSLSFQAFLGI